MVGTQKAGSTPLFEGRSPPPLGPVRLRGNKVLQFLARLERPFLERILCLAGVQDEKFLFLHNPLRDLARPYSTKYSIKKDNGVSHESKKGYCEGQT